MLRLVGLFDRQLREAYELIDQWDRPYVTDAAAFEEAFGRIETTPHDRGDRRDASRRSSGAHDDRGLSRLERGSGPR
jgi:hypothetical protein